MATKAAKSITINATKYELANGLDVANGKLQLKAKDVVLDEVEVTNSPLIVNVTISGSTATTDVDYADVIDAWYKGRPVIIRDVYGYPAGIGDVKVIAAYYNAEYEIPYDYTSIGVCTAITAGSTTTITFRPHYDSGTDAYVERTWDVQRV